MLKEKLKKLLNSDLRRMQIELFEYLYEEDIWKIQTRINNSSGNICLQIIDNLNTYIGKELGKIEHKKTRELEFSLVEITRNELIQKIDDTIEIINQTLDNFDNNLIEKDFPILVFEHKTSIQNALVFLASRLSYNLWQVNYHRRMSNGY